MGPLFEKLFDQSMMPHGHCYLWNDNLVNLYVISDLVIALSYYSIPIALITLIKKRHDLQFNYLFQLFALFIFACGTTHLISIYNVWNGAYWFSGTAKALTALVSVLTAILVWPMIPKALAIPSTNQLKALNGELQQEIANNRELRDSLERMVYSRTEELENIRSEVTMQAQRYRALAQSLEEVIVVTNKQGEIIERQPSWEAFTGQQWSDDAGYDIYGAIAEEHHAQFKSLCPLNNNDKDFKAPSKANLKIFSNSKQGFVLCEVTLSPVSNENGELVEQIAVIKH